MIQVEIWQTPHLVTFEFGTRLVAADFAGNLIETLIKERGIVGKGTIITAYDDGTELYTFTQNAKNGKN